MVNGDNPWIGIDFGTCRTSAAVFLAGEIRQVNLGYGAFSGSLDMPTAVFFETGGQILVGEQAVRARFRDPQRFLDRFKLDIGTPRPNLVSATYISIPISWPEIVAAVLTHVRRAAEKSYNNDGSLTRAVLTVPAIYTPNGIPICVMKEAAALAGFREVQVIREPHAAALCYDYLLRQGGESRASDGELSLVYDLGGGTFDPALIRRDRRTYKIERAAAETGVRCGGIFFDEVLRRDFRAKCPESFAYLKPPARNSNGVIADKDSGRSALYAKNLIDLDKFLMDAKHSFSQLGVDEFDESAPPTYERNYHLTRAEFNTLISSMLDTTIDCCNNLLKNAGAVWKDVSRVILVGGSCNLPIVRERLQAAAQNAGATNVEICWQRIKGTNRVIDPMLAVCQGAAISILDTVVGQDLLSASQSHSYSPMRISSLRRVPRLSNDPGNYRPDMDIVSLGMSGSGKSVLLLSMYSMMDGTNGRLRLSTRMTDDEQDLFDRSQQLLHGTWPQETLRARNWEFYLDYGVSETLGIRWYDYRGGVLRERQEVEDVREFRQKVKEASCVILCVAGDELAAYVDGGPEPKGIRQFNLLMNVVYSERGDVPFVVVAITKADLCPAEELREGISQLGKGLLCSFFVEGSPFRVAFCPVSLGLNLGSGLSAVNVCPCNVDLPITLAAYMYLDVDVDKKQRAMLKATVQTEEAVQELKKLEKRFQTGALGALFPLTIGLPATVLRQMVMKEATARLERAKQDEAIAEQGLQIARAKLEQISQKISADAILYKGGRPFHLV